MLGVHEYFVFDPLDEYLSPRLQGFRLVGEYYQPVDLAPDGMLFSHELGLTLRPEGTLLQLVDPRSGEALPTLEEAVELALAETRRAEAERADTAEAELARLRAELERLQGQ
jgi:hypothetical protein